MKNLKNLVLFTVLFIVLSVVSAFADGVKDMSKYMWTWSTMETVLHEVNPSVPPVEAENLIIDSMNRLNKIIAAIATLEDLIPARKIANEFLSMGGFEEEVGAAVNRMIDRQEKFLQAHNQ
ncbi:MAG: hypothetical protein HQM10_17135 [Candidatus Riflebacteria bacterium]|nr:hypothetical protein [Candidatus Riflebacteria bacterium]